MLRRALSRYPRSALLSMTTETGYSSQPDSFLRLPPPQPAGNRAGQAMSCLPRHHHNLSAMMCLMRDEVGHHVGEIQREISPHVALRWRNPAGSQAQFEERLHAGAAPLQCRNNLALRGPGPINMLRSLHAVLAANRLDPHA